MDILNLEIYDEKIGKFIKKHDNCFLELLDVLPTNVPYTEGMNFRKLANGKLITFLIEKGYINNNWVVAYDLWQKIYDKPLLFRGINPNYYSVFLEYGTDRYALKGYDLEFKELGIPKKDLLWASTYISKAWEYVHQNNPSIILIYDHSFFRSITPGLTHAWVRKDKTIKFKETVKAVFVVSYKY